MPPEVLLKIGVSEASDKAFKLILSLPFLWLLFLFLAPLFFVFIYGFSEVENIIGLKLTWTISNYSKIFESVYLGILLKSARIALITTFLCLIFGFLIAFYIAMNPSQKQRLFLLFLIILPFWTNLLIRTYALIAVLRTNGYLNDLLEILWNPVYHLANLLQPGQTLLGSFERPEILYNNFAVVFGLVYVHLPFAVLPLYAALVKIDKSVIEASFDLGAGKLGTLFRVIIPSVPEGIYAAVLITFVPVLGSFLTPDLLGGNDSQMIANLIDRQFKGANNWPFGSALSCLLMYILFAIIALKSLLKNK